MKLSGHMKADLLLVGVTLLAALGWMFSKEALAGIPPLLFIGIRFLLAGLILFPFGWSKLLRLDRQGWLFSIGVGLSFTLGIMFWIMGLHYASHIGVGAFLTSLGVVLVPVLALLFGDRPGRSVWAALPLAALGMASLSLDSELVIGKGELFFLISAVAFALFYNLNSRVASRISVIALSVIQLIVVGLVALMISALTETWRVEASFELLGWLLASVLIATSVRFFIQTWAQGMAPVSHTAVIMTLEPVWTALLAIWWFSETMTPMQLLGCGLIFSALLVNRWPALMLWMKDSYSSAKDKC